MTIICNQCYDSGKYLKRITEPLLDFVRLPITGSYTVKEVFCTCKFGRRLQQLEEQSKSPDYINPFTGLDDEQIICMLNRSVEFDDPNDVNNL